jgi:HNH endonuclease
MRKTLYERFIEKFEMRGPDECWPWTAAKGTGYGQIWDNSRGRVVLAHRLSWEIFRGPIPAGYEVDHQCHTPECKLTAECPHRACVNPAHLKPMTHQNNGSRGNGVGGENTRKTRCKRDHEFTPENTYIQQGARQCRACLREKEERRQQSLIRQQRRALGLNVKTGKPLKKRPNGSLTPEEKREQNRAAVLRYKQRRRERLRSLKETS